MSVVMTVKESELDYILQELQEEIMKNDILILIKEDEDFDKFINMNNTKNRVSLESEI